jgi:hypothetical protein
MYKYILIHFYKYVYWLNLIGNLGKISRGSNNNSNKLAPMKWGDLHIVEQCSTASYPILQSASISFRHHFDPTWYYVEYHTFKPKHKMYGLQYWQETDQKLENVRVCTGKSQTGKLSSKRFNIILTKFTVSKILTCSDHPQPICNYNYIWNQKYHYQKC